MGGMVLETNMNEIVAQVELQNRMEKSEVSVYYTHTHTYHNPALFRERMGLLRVFRGN